jgi:N-acetyl-gamma-glutamyl-phosphate reductase
VDPGHGGSSKARGCASQGDANRVQGNGSPELQNVVGSNLCDVSVVARGRQLVAMAALDNLIKGMAGTAIQNMNLMCGLEETTGLWTPSLRPV